jgi:glucose dehydrogenase
MRAVVGPITSSNVSQLGVAWCVPLESTGATRAAGLSNGYATTPVVVNGVVYTQDLESNVMAIIAYELGAKGKLPTPWASDMSLWRRCYDWPKWMQGTPKDSSAVMHTADSPE